MLITNIWIFENQFLSFIARKLFQKILKDILIDTELSSLHNDLFSFAFRSKRQLLLHSFQLTVQFMSCEIDASISFSRRTITCTEKISTYNTQVNLSTLRLFFSCFIERESTRRCREKRFRMSTLFQYSTPVILVLISARKIVRQEV